MTDKTRVLFLAADPFHDRAPLRLDEEMRGIDHALRQGDARDTLELVSHFATRTSDLHTALLRHRPRIVHFAGHGGRGGGIYLGDDTGRPRAVDRDALRHLFGILKGTTRVVVLNGCDTLPVVEALAEVVDYAIGMNQPIEDASAIAFARAFYTALGFGSPVREAFDLGVNQLKMDCRRQAGIPELRARAGAAEHPAAAIPATGAQPWSALPPGWSAGSLMQVNSGAFAPDDTAAFPRMMQANSVQVNRIVSMPESSSIQEG